MSFLLVQKAKKYACHNILHKAMSTFVDEDPQLKSVSNQQQQEQQTNTNEEPNNNPIQTYLNTRAGTH